MKKPLNKLHLQLIAILSMTIDHLTWLIFPGYSHNPIAIVLHIIGRLAFPIFAFFIAEGYHYTHDKKKYMLRLFIFALISHVPYMMQSGAFKEYGWLSLIPFATGNGISRFLNQASVLWGYFIGLVMLCVNDSQKLNNFAKVILIALLCVVSFLGDWSCIASLVVLSIGSNRGKPLAQILWSMFYVTLYGVVYFFTADWLYGVIQLFVFLAIPVLALYNGRKSENEKLNKIMRNFFYIYYPLHLFIIGIIGIIIK